MSVPGLRPPSPGRPRERCLDAVIQDKRANGHLSSMLMAYVGIDDIYTRYLKLLQHKARKAERT